MRISHPRYLTTCAALIITMSFAPAMFAQGILIGDAKSQPESLTMAPGGVLIVGSASSPFVYKVRPGSTTAEKFIDASTEARGHILPRHVGRRLHQHVVDMPTDAGAEHHSGTAAYRAEKFRSHHRRAEDPLEPARRQQCLQRFHDRTGQGALHYRHHPRQNLQAAGRSVHRGTLPRASHADGRRWHHLSRWHALCEQRDLQQALPHPRRCRRQTGTPVDIWMDQPVKGPDGMRAANGKLILAENGSGKISVLTVNGDKASVTVIKDGLNTPTGVEPAGDTIWIAERGAGKAVSVPMPK